MESVNTYGIHEFTKVLQDMKQTNYNTSEARGVPVIQQTERNKVRRGLVNALAETLKTLLTDEENGNVANVYLTSEGVAIEVENESVGKVEGNNGFVSFIVDIKMKDLLYDAMTEEEAYATDIAEKEAKAQKAAEAKAAKIAKAKQARAKNKEA